MQGFKRGPDIDANSRFNEVGPGYFRTLGMPLVAGREFTAADALGSPKVAIVNEAFAKKFNLGRDAIGKFMGASGDDSTDMQIVGRREGREVQRVKDAGAADVHHAVSPGQHGRQPALLRADVRRSRADAARDSGRREEARPESSGRESEDAAAAGEGERLSSIG